MKSSKKGCCIICGDRVFTEEEYIESLDGYCHTECLVESSMINSTEPAEEPA